MGTDMNELESIAEEMATEHLVNEILRRERRIKSLGKLNTELIEKMLVKNRMERELRVLRPILKSRQIRMKGF